MTNPTPELSLATIARAMGTLRQLKQHIEAVRQDFMPEGDRPQLPSEVTQFHLRREMMALDRQIRQALLIAFGEHSTQVRQFRELRFGSAASRSFQDGRLLLDRFIGDLERRRLHVLGASGAPAVPGIDPMTDLYTEAMLRRYLAHEMAWSQREGDPLGLLLLRFPQWSSLTRCYGESIAKEWVISMACVLKTSPRAYDFPCRLNDAEFGVALRRATALDIHEITRRMMLGVGAAAAHLLPDAELPIEVTSAIYPYDAEHIDDLFAYAAAHWTRVTD